VISVFRGGFGNMDLGVVASALFKGLGGGGGHKNMARAEMALADVPEEFRNGLEEFVFQRMIAAEKSQRNAKKARKPEE
jgi:hypothetical protein